MVGLHRRSASVLTPAGSLAPLRQPGIGEISLASPLQSRRPSCNPEPSVRIRKLSKTIKTAKLAEERKREAIQTAELAEEASGSAVVRQSDQVGAKFQGNSLRSNVRSVDRQAGTGAFAQDQNRFSTPTLVTLA